ncbi:hypothetical protein ACFL3X_00025 [Gemmatimonadota bacterium]
MHIADGIIATEICIAADVASVGALYAFGRRVRPDIVAFDEPFSNLNPAMVEQLIGIVKGLEATVIIVSQSIIPVLADQLKSQKGVTHCTVARVATS